MPLSMRRLNRASSIAELRRPTPKISTPVIQSSTNLHINEMMDLRTAQRMMASRVSLDTNTSSSPPPSSSQEPDLTDGSSAGSSPTIEPNHLTAYFPSPTGANLTSPISPAPAIPQRVPSHSKREHERLARKRSLRGNSNPTPVASAPIAEAPSFVQTISPPPGPTPTIEEERNSTAMIGNGSSQALPKLVTPAHSFSPRSPAGRTPLGPFTPELHRLTQALQEQFMAVPSLDEDDTMYMRRLGLAKFDASAYCTDIALDNPFSEAPIATSFHQVEMTAWI